MMRGHVLTLVAVGACAHAAAPRPAENSQALVEGGMAQFEAGKLADAEASFERAAGLGNSEAWDDLAYIRVYRGDEAGMWKAFDHGGLVEHDRDLARAWMLFAMGKLDDALAADALAGAHVAKATDPQEWVKAPMLRGGLLIELGRYQDAIQPLETAIQRVPEAGLADHPYFRAVPLALLAWAKAGARTADADAAASAFDAVGVAHPGDPIVAAFAPIVHEQRALAHDDVTAATAALASCDGAMCLEHLAELQARTDPNAAAQTRAKVKTLFKMSPPAAYYWHKAQR